MFHLVPVSDLKYNYCICFYLSFNVPKRSLIISLHQLFGEKFAFRLPHQVEKKALAFKYLQSYLASDHIHFKSLPNPSCLFSVF